MNSLQERFDGPYAVVAVLVLLLVSYLIGRLHARSAKHGELKGVFKTERAELNGHRRENDQTDIELIRRTNALNTREAGLRVWESNLQRREALLVENEPISTDPPALRSVDDPEVVAEAAG